MSFKTNEEILSSFSLWPQHFTWDNYKTHLHRRVLVLGLHQLADLRGDQHGDLAARWRCPPPTRSRATRFLGDKHVFFWLLTNRMTPPAVFLLPFFQLYTTLGLMDTHIAVALAHLLFNVPLAVWILEGFMSGIPREIDETAYIDGYSFPRFFLTIFMPLIKAGVGVAAFFCFMFSWVELLMARTLTSVNAKPIVAMMTRTVSALGHGLGRARRGRRADHRAGRDRDLVRAPLHRQGLRDGPGLKESRDVRLDGLDHCRWRCSSPASC